MSTPPKKRSLEKSLIHNDLHPIISRYYGHPHLNFSVRSIGAMMKHLWATIIVAITHYQLTHTYKYYFETKDCINTSNVLDLMRINVQTDAEFNSVRDKYTTYFKTHVTPNAIPTQWSIQHESGLNQTITLTLTQSNKEEIIGLIIKKLGKDLDCDYTNYRFNKRMN